MMLIGILAMLLLAGPSPAELHDAMLLITGASSVEELDEQVIERFCALHDNPIPLNTGSRSRLLASGLFTEYQVVSLSDYLSRSGDILSWTELGLVDGFSPELADALSLFCSIDNASLDQHRLAGVRQDLMVRSAIKLTGDDDASICYGAKYNMALGDVIELNWGSRTTYSESAFGPGTASLAAYGRRGRLVLGDFNARYGQGLCQWSGFTMSSYSSVTAMHRKATGLSASRSFTRTLHGVGADLDLGRWNIGGAWGWPGTGIIHGGRYGRKLTAGATAMFSMKDGLSASADWRAGTGSLCFYGESAWNSKSGVSAVAGLLHSPSYGARDAVLCKWQNGSLQTVAGFQNKFITSTIDAIWDKSYKALLIVNPSFTAGEFALCPAARVQYRYKPGDSNPSRLEIRAEGKAQWRGRWQLSGRYDQVKCKDRSWLWYAECGHSSPALSAYLRFTLFKIDNWADRIWVYERDAPGNFNVPAYSGRGFAASITASYKHRKQCLHLRAGTVRYPWNLQSKSPKTEIKLQYQLKL